MNQSATSAVFFIVIGRLPIHSHRQTPALVIGTNTSPLLDLVISDCFSSATTFIGNFPTDWSPLLHQPIYISLTPDAYQKIRVKNGVNTCPPISEYKIINAPKFSAVITHFRNYFSQFGNQLPNLNNLGPILLQIPRISQPLNQISPLYTPIDNITVRENCRWIDQAILYSEISSKS